MSDIHDPDGAAPRANLLNASERQALDRLCSNRYRRGRNRWETPGDRAISLNVAATLRQYDLAVIRHGTGRERLEATAIGAELREMIRRKRQERNAKRRADA